MCCTAPLYACSKLAVCTVSITFDHSTASVLGATWQTALSSLFKRCMSVCFLLSVCWCFHMLRSPLCSEEQSSYAHTLSQIIQTQCGSRAWRVLCNDSNYSRHQAQPTVCNCNRLSIPSQGHSGALQVTLLYVTPTT